MVIRYIPVKHHPVPVEPSLLVAQCEKAGFARSSSALKKHVCVTIMALTVRDVYS